MATNSRELDAYYDLKCLSLRDRPGLLFSNFMLDRSLAIELTLDCWDNFWSEIGTGESRFDNASVECLFVVQMLLDCDDEPMSTSPKGVVRHYLKKGASNSDIRYILVVLRDEVVALRKLRLNGGTSGESSS